MFKKTNLLVQITPLDFGSLMVYNYNESMSPEHRWIF